MAYKDPIKQKEAQHASYLRNKDKVALASRTQRLRNQRFVDDLKRDKPCSECNQVFHPAAMDYHHKEPVDKVERISYLIARASRARLLAEIEKCELICSNCHRVLEHGQTERFVVE